MTLAMQQSLTLSTRTITQRILNEQGQRGISLVSLTAKVHLNEDKEVSLIAKATLVNTYDKEVSCFIVKS